MPRRVVVVAVAAVLAVVTAACINQADDNPLVSGETTTTRPDDGPTTTAAAEPEGFTPEPIEWEDCQYGECARVVVPLDHADPSGETIEVGVARVPASGDRIGALFVNPGGPGAPGMDFAANLGLLLPDAITERFDIVAVDPRGVGESTPVDCGGSATDLYSVDPTIEDAADRQALLEVSEAYVDDCTIKHGGLLPFVGTRDVARDMDVVRAAMGDEQLSYLGFSYGTAIGQVYADLFPQRVRAMVLDGVLELGPSGLDLAREQAAGFETALARWVEHCRRNGCETAADPLGAVEQVLRLAEQPGGIRAPSADRPAGPGEANLGISLALYSRSLWNDLDGALTAAIAGDGSELVDLADRYIGLGDFEIYFAVNCMDFSWPTGDPDAFLRAAKETAMASPHFGEALVNDYIRCVDWPVAPTPLAAVTAPGTPPIVVISTTGDPATPYQAGVDVAAQLAGGVLVTNEGEGHTVVADGKRCIDDLVAAYLVDGTVPPDGTVCP